MTIFSKKFISKPKKKCSLSDNLDLRAMMDFNDCIFGCSVGALFSILFCFTGFQITRSLIASKTGGSEKRQSHGDGGKKVLRMMEYWGRFPITLIWNVIFIQNKVRMRMVSS